MIICFPTDQDKGLDSVSYPHFGSASFFIIYDTENEKTETIENHDQHHDHGTCHPMIALNETKVDAVVVGGIGRRALSGLNEMGIKIFQSTEETVSTLVKKLLADELKEMTFQNTCTEHNGCH
ncbi:NifB/NifX family molybdenum-iron cluster-binding protein [Candidatus Latescibacterota bacterium]